MKNIMLIGFVGLLSITACNKDNTESTKSLAEQKIEFQTRQLEIERQKLAIEKERMVYDQQKKADSILEVQTKKTAVANIQPKTETIRTVYVGNTPRNNSSSSNNSNSGNGDYEAPVARKRGMSSAAKGTIIGTVGGAAAGAIIAKKNKGLGAVIGGVAGGATGYTIGRAADRKSGRVQPRR